MLFFARAMLLGACLVSLLAAALRWSLEHTETTIGRAVNGIADAPAAIVGTLSDLTGDPYRKSLVPDEFANTAGFIPIPDHSRHRISGLVMRKGPSQDLPPAGWRLLWGIFDVDGTPGYAVVALAPDFSIRRVWPIGDAILHKHHFSIGQMPFPHGFAILPDGSMLLAFDNVYLPLRIDSCGRPLWSGDARITHAFTPDDAGKAAWGVGSEGDIREIDLATGRTVRRISVDQLRKANPELGVFDARRIDDNALGENPRNDPPRYFDDPFHINDVEPLPRRLAAAFPEFAPGDLLVSMRSLNLIAVIDPRTLKMRWLSNDLTLRQHDPDWEPDGTITVFDNQNGHAASRIVRIDPRMHTHTVVLPGEPLAFYSRIRGKHQSLPGGGMLVTSSQQGRIFEVGGDHRISFELLVHAPGHPAKNFVTSEAVFLPTDSPTLRKVLSCPET